MGTEKGSETEDIITNGFEGYVRQNAKSVALYLLAFLSAVKCFHAKISDG